MLLALILYLPVYFKYAILHHLIFLDFSFAMPGSIFVKH